MFSKTMTQEEIKLVVKKSTLPSAGKGLFTKTRIVKGTRILEYTGKISTWKAVNHDEGFNPYIFYVTRNHVIDAAEDTSILGRYANDARGLTRVKGITNNCQFVIKSRRVYIESFKTILPGSEILVGYGKEYWEVIKKNKAIDMASKKVQKKKK